MKDASLIVQAQVQAELIELYKQRDDMNTRIERAHAMIRATNMTLAEIDKLANPSTPGLKGAVDGQKESPILVPPKPRPQH